MKRTVTTSLAAIAASLALLASPAAAATTTAPASTPTVSASAADSASPTGVGHGGQIWFCKTFGIFC